MKLRLVFEKRFLRLNKRNDLEKLPSKIHRPKPEAFAETQLACENPP